MGKNLRRKCMLGGIILVLLFIAVAYAYFRVYTKTPEYAVKQVESAIETHDKAKFSRYVNMDSVLDSSYDALVAALIEAQNSEGAEAKAAIEDFVHMMKAPLISSFKMATDHYIETGTWEQSADDEKNKKNPSMDVEQILEKTGLLETTFRGIDTIEADDATGTAVAHVQVFQQEANDIFVFDVKLERQDSGDWQIVEITNFQAFVSFVVAARQEKLKVYADTTEKIQSIHNTAMLRAQDNFMQTLSDGSLGNEETRMALKRLMEETILPDWQQRKSELEAVDVPAAAQSLQHLRLKICDLHIDYAEGYAAWLEDKKAETIREAERQLKQARTLEQEERFLARRISGQK